MTTLKTSVVDISPKLAAKWLKSKKSNRPVSDVTVQRYLDQINNGAWELSGDTIKFNGNGDLLDGQHRLRAIIASKKTVKSLVVRGVASKAFDVIDTGRPRILRDVLVLDGVNANYALASAVKWAYRLSTDPRLKTKKYGSNRQALEWFKQAKGFMNSIKFGRLARSMLRSEGVGTALHYLFGQHDRELADAFMLSLAEGTGLTSESPVYHLRERLIKNAMSKTRLHRNDIIATTIKTWNLLRAGKKDVPRQAIVWVGRGPQAEDFPVIR